MRTGLAIVAILTSLILMVGGAWLAWNLVLAGPGGCATALMQGTLVEHEGTLGIANPALAGGTPAIVDWPFGYAVERRDGQLVLTRVFAVVAHEGDSVSMGGGFTDADDRFDGCGAVTLGLLDPPGQVLEPKATFIVMATAAQPCLVPPSGCGYTVRLTAPSGETSEATFEDGRSYGQKGNGVKAALRTGPGLPTALAPGTYRLDFETVAYSDMVSFDADGKELGPEITLACSATIDVTDTANDHVVTVRVAYDGSACTIEPATFVEAASP